VSECLTFALNSTYNPQNPEVGDSVTVNSATIRNKGEGASNSPFTVKLFINDVAVKTVEVTESLSAGESKTINFNYQWQIEGKPYVIKVEAIYNYEEVTKTNNAKDARLEPKPWLKITTNKDTYKGDGEKVNINIEFYTPDNNDLLLIKETCDGHVEYCSVIGLSSLTNPITIPALPVYNNKKHIISGSLLTSAGSQLTTDKAEYIVESTDDVDMIILTNPEKLQKQFKKADWLDILYDIQLATDDEGILLYTDKSSYSDISWDIHCADWVLETIDYLFILGGDDVIPYRKIDIDGDGNESVADNYYWDFNNYGHTPAIRYARLPTTKSRLGCRKSLDRYLNKEVFDNILKNETNSPKIVSSALLISGRDVNNRDIDIDHFDEISKYVRSKLQNEKKVSVIDEYALELNWGIWPSREKAIVESVKSTYDGNDLETADLIFIVGHGLPSSITIDNTTNHSVECGDNAATSGATSKCIGPECWEKIKFYNNSFNQFVITLKSGASSIFPRKLDLPVVFAYSCLTADHAEANMNPLLSEAFMHFNAGSYAGWGTTARVGAADVLAQAYFDQVVVEQDLGTIFNNSMNVAADNINKKLSWTSKSKTLMLKNLDYVIQYGYPKWEIDPDGDVPDYSNPILPSSVDFDVTAYNISTLYNTTTINFTGVLNGEFITSTDWKLQGNPIIPYVHLVYDLPLGKTMDSITFNTDYEAFLGQYNLSMLPGSYFGPLYEYYPLNLTAYMEQPVKWKVFEKTDGNMTVVIDIFPFQYYPSNGTVIFYNNFTISTSERDRTASIDSVSTDKRLYVKGDVAEITVNCTGAALIDVSVDGVSLIAQYTSGSNVFTVDTSTLSAGSHDVDIKLYEEDPFLSPAVVAQSASSQPLFDEMLTSFSVVDSLINMSLEAGVNATARGSLLDLSILVTNLGGTATVVSPDLVVETENVSRMSLGNLTLSAHESTFINTTLDTTEMPLGMVIIYAEAVLDTITVNANYETVTIYEDISDIVIDYEIEPEVIHLAFSNPYVDNVHYSLDSGFNTSLYEPYDIDISHLTVGSTHNLTVYADDVFGNENSTSFQFVRSASTGFDTGYGTYPSISGTHTGTITPNKNITVSKLYTYPCPGTGGHAEYVHIYGDDVDKSASWTGYEGDWHNLTFDAAFILEEGETYNYEIRTGSYPQIHHTDALPTENGWINCTSFEDVNGKTCTNWIPAIKLFL